MLFDFSYNKVIHTYPNIWFEIVREREQSKLQADWCLGEVYLVFEIEKLEVPNLFLHCA